MFFFPAIHCSSSWIGLSHSISFRTLHVVNDCGLSLLLFFQQNFNFNIFSLHHSTNLINTTAQEDNNKKYRVLEYSTHIPQNILTTVGMLVLVVRIETIQRLQEYRIISILNSLISKGDVKERLVKLYNLSIENKLFLF